MNTDKDIDNRVELSTKDRLKFLWLLLTYKLIAPFECQNHRITVLLREFLFVFHTFTKFRYLRYLSKKVIKLKTNFGEFYIRDINIDWLIASPAFERQDLNKLLSIIETFLKQHPNNKVIFIDIGASIGKFTVSVGKFFRNYANRLKIFSFEPNLASFELLTKNIRLNRLKNVEAFNLAISSRKKKLRFFFYEPMQMIVSFWTPQEVVINVDTIDRILGKQVNSNTILFVKLDVEGHELEALEGMKNIINKADESHLLVEDSAEKTKNILRIYLFRNFKFDRKITPHNSFWFK